MESMEMNGQQHIPRAVFIQLSRMLCTQALVHASLKWQSGHWLAMDCMHGFGNDDHSGRQNDTHMDQVACDNYDLHDIKCMHIS